MTRPRLLDLFCGAGGAAMGYHRAGFDVVGVDINYCLNYPFTYYVGDWEAFLDAGWAFDAIHASPPCPAYSTLKSKTTKDHPRLVEAVRERLIATGLPYVIENVPGAPLRNPIVLCGSSFGLGANGRQLRRHRLFETNFPVMALPCNHHGQPIGVYGTGGGGQMTRGYKGTQEEYVEAMGIDWATRAEIAQAIPPAYTEHIGHYLLAEVRRREREGVAA